MYTGARPEAASIARPKAVPAPAPASEPPLSAQVITSSSESTRPTEMTPMMFSRESAISAQAANTMTAASWRFTAASVVRSAVLSASRKKQTAPAESTASASAGTMSFAGSAPEESPPSRPVAAIIAAAQAGMNHTRPRTRESMKIKPTVKMSTQAAA